MFITVGAATTCKSQIDILPYILNVFHICVCVQMLCDICGGHTSTFHPVSAEVRVKSWYHGPCHHMTQLQNCTSCLNHIRATYMYMTSHEHIITRRAARYCECPLASHVLYIPCIVHLDMVFIPDIFTHIMFYYRLSINRGRILRCDITTMNAIRQGESLNIDQTKNSQSQTTPHTSHLRASYVASLWIIWRKYITRYLECTLYL